MTSRGIGSTKTGKTRRNDNNVSSKSTMNKLELMIKDYDSKMKELDEKMAELVHYAMPGKYSNTKEYKDKKEQFYRAQRKYNKYRAEKDKLTDEYWKEKRKNEPKSNNHKTFVNSFGQATKRIITTSTYERAKKREDRNVLRNMGY